MGVGETCIMRSSIITFIIYRAELVDGIKRRVTVKAYKDKDYIYREHDITSGGICRHGDELQG
jgi:hypothetical protein